MTWYRTFSTYSDKVKGHKGHSAALKPVKFTWSPPRIQEAKNIYEASREAIERAKDEAARRTG